MKKRWLLLITRDMRLYMPPELFWRRSTADFEARRWLWFLFGLTRISDKRLAGGQVKVGVRSVLHLFEMEMPESWGAMRLWACLATNEDRYPKLDVDLIAGDFNEGKAWVLQHSRKSEAPGESFGAEWCYENTFHRRGVKHYVAAHRLRSGN
jgi:hypothetical protein